MTPKEKRAAAYQRKKAQMTEEERLTYNAKRLAYENAKNARKREEAIREGLSSSKNIKPFKSRSRTRAKSIANNEEKHDRGTATIDKYFSPSTRPHNLLACSVETFGSETSMDSYDSCSTVYYSGGGEEEEEFSGFDGEEEEEFSGFDQRESCSSELDAPIGTSLAQPSTYKLDESALDSLLLPVTYFDTRAWKHRQIGPRFSSLEEAQLLLQAVHHFGLPHLGGPLSVVENIRRHYLPKRSFCDIEIMATSGAIVPI